MDDALQHFVAFFAVTSAKQYIWYGYARCFVRKEKRHCAACIGQLLCTRIFENVVYSKDLRKPGYVFRKFIAISAAHGDRQSLRSSSCGTISGYVVLVTGLVVSSRAEITATKIWLTYPRFAQVNHTFMVVL